MTLIYCLAEIEAYRLSSQLEVPDFVKNFVTYSNAAGMSAHGISFATGFYTEKLRQTELVLKELETDLRSLHIHKYITIYYAIIMPVFFVYIYFFFR